MENPQRRQSDVQLAVMLNDLEYIKKAVDEMKFKIEKHYVTQQEFLPIRNLVYGMVALILTGVIGGILTMVLRQ